MSENHAQVVIIGTGPAGYTAAIYTARAELSPLVIEGIQPGGQLTITTDVENYPGFPEGVMGPEMMTLFRKQAERFETRFLTGQVEKVDFSKRPFKLTVDADTEITADAVIVSTGASARYLGLESETKLMGYGVSACATCDGFFYRGKEVVVIGGGDSAMEEATFLTRFASKVTIIHRRDEFRASKIMQQRALDNEKIEVIWDATVTEVLGDPQAGGVTGVKVKNLETDDVSELACHGMFVAIGHTPNTTFLEGHLELDENGYIKVAPGRTFTSVEGVFACGDCIDPIYRQAVTAAGTGCAAALDAERWLAEQAG
ncbi:MAG: thioredoxin-disulfide reductase [Proteobacteria bacterium]|nr:MAG: thioredoxin-disulfide reductase [Pseudomonadota bacterium]PIE17704.1 MAG: thioredoxin-disulfide reductase [Pseudomonadota bacterium]